MAAIRGARGAEGRFVQLRNAAGQDERLSLEARGIIFLVLSLPIGQRFTRQWLVDRVAGRNGRRMVDNALAELEQYGYFRKTPPTSAGRGKWEWEDQVITDDPALLSSDRNRSDESTSENSSNGASSQVSSCDRFSPDDERPDKDLKDVDLKDEDLKDGRGSAADSSPVADALSRMIIGEIQNLTGGAITREHAERIGAQLLAKRADPPDNPVEWTRAVIRAAPNPRNFLPTPVPPRFTAPPRVAPPSADVLAAAHAAISHLKRTSAPTGDLRLRNVAAEQLAEHRAGRDPQHPKAAEEAA
jgi:hypothetical protein